MRVSVVHEHVRVRRQSVAQVNTCKRRAPAEMKRRHALARLKKRKLSWPDNARVEARGHLRYPATLACGGGQGVSGRSRRYVHIARDRPR